MREGVSRDDTRREVVVPAPRTVGWQGCSSPAPASARIPRLPARVAPVDVARRVRRAVVPEEPDPQGVQVLRLLDDAPARAGITCIVGPNGSGKSNVVDALAWVMGEQGAKSLRGGKMEDVIFAGTSGRPPLGRAEVLLTIDNTDGALPIEYAEVTISRTMFRNGGSEYAINGSPCRLLDVQELLSDSGIGREMHVIVGQGQLDTILHATPEDRRGFIEEAAGVLKHRKRKEKALRKLDSTEGNLTRLGDLLSEIRRQLKPLGRQAEVARRAAAVQADVRDARARLIADDLVTARTALEQELADESVLVERRARGRGRDRRRPARPRPRSRPRCARTCPRWPRPRRPGSRSPGCASGCAAPQSLAAERVRNAAGTTEAEDVRVRPRPRRARGRGRAGPRAGAADRGRGRRAPHRARAGRRRPRRPPRTPPPRRSAGSPACSAPPPTGARGWPGCTARSTRLKSPRRGRRRGGRPARPWPARRRWPAPTAPSATSPRWRPGSPASTPARRASTPSTRPPPPPSTTSRSGWPRPATRRSRPTATAPALAARKDALELGLNRKDGAGALLAATDSVSGLLGSVAALLSVRAGYETAVAAALGSAADAVAVARRRRGGRAPSTTSRATTSAAPGCCSAAAPPTTATGPGCPADATYAVDVVECPDGAAPGAGPAAVQGRRGRRPRRRPRAGRRRCPTSPR